MKKQIGENNTCCGWNCSKEDYGLSCPQCARYEKEIQDLKLKLREKITGFSHRTDKPGELNGLKGLKLQMYLRALDDIEKEKQLDRVLSEVATAKEERERAEKEEMETRMYIRAKGDILREQENRKWFKFF